MPPKKKITPPLPMPAPIEFQIAFMMELTKALAPAIDRAWDTATRAIAMGAQVPRQEEPEPPLPPTPPRIPKGKAREVVLQVVGRFHDRGASRADIRRLVPGLMAGRPMKENTLKATLKALRDGQAIELRDDRWWLKKK